LLIRKLVLGTSRIALVRRMVTSRRVYRGFVLRFVAGENLEQALPVLRDLHAKGMRVSADFLGESVTDAGLARKVVDEYRRIIEDGLPQLTGVSSVSVKPSQLGMEVDPELCLSHTRELVECARRTGNHLVRIDMEDHTYVDRTLELYERLREEGFENVGVVLQSCLRRTPGDLDRLEKWSPEIRLVKGAYLEPPTVAFATKREVDEAYMTLSRRMLEGDFRPAFATHDPKVIDGIRAIAKELGLAPNEVEFQMLLGIGREQQNRLNDEGYAVRIYVPHGCEWYAYFSRRLAERPANMWFVLKHLLHD
jgi:proline dehydrogenase